MLLPPNLPEPPHTILDPGRRWLPDKSGVFDQKLLPLVQELRKAVKAWRDENYKDASKTSIALLNWWFGSARLQEDWTYQFRYYFAQREAIETIIYLFEVADVKDAHGNARQQNIQSRKNPLSKIR